MSNAQTRGWGPGWPTDRSRDMKPLSFITGSVHVDLHELIELLCRETVRRGYEIRRGWSWGYANRPIGGTRTPSNHSWGIAVDLNAPTNPMRNPFTSDMPAWLPKLWESYGFRWGGRYTRTPDPMHFEFMGTPANARRQTERARANFSRNETSEEYEMKRGDHGPAVNLLQRCLVNESRIAGRSDPLPEHGIDGDFGEETEDAVKRYQRAAGVPSTGRADGVTVALLLRYENR